MLGVGTQKSKFIITLLDRAFGNGFVILESLQELCLILKSVKEAPLWGLIKPSITIEPKTQEHPKSTRWSNSLQAKVLRHIYIYIYNLTHK